MDKPKNFVLSGAEAREGLLKGMSAVHAAVAHTLGASGRNTAFKNWSGHSVLSNDGVSNANEINPAVTIEEMGADLIKQVCQKTNKEVGDGTTTSEVIAFSMATQGVKLLKSDPTVNPMKLRKEITEASEKVIAKLKDLAIPCSTLEDLENVATISVESPEYGKIIAQTIFDAGDNGVVLVNEDTNEGVTVKRVEGYEFTQGWLSPYMVTNPYTMVSELKNCFVLCTEIQLHLTQELTKIFDNLNFDAKNKGIKNSLLIICDEIHPDVITFAGENNIAFLKNEPDHNVWCTIVKKPMQANMLEDIAVLVGAEAMTKDRGILKVAKEYLGKAEKIIVKKDGTTIITDELAKERINAHVEKLLTQVAEAKDDEHLQQKLKERIAKLTGGVFYINVGGRTEQEAKYNKLKIDDAVNATKSAKAEGIVAGGGAALYNIAKKFPLQNGLGELLVIKSIMAPFKQILKNSGEVEEGWVESGLNWGYNALTNQFVDDVIAEGIIDPVKSTISALRNSASFAGLFLTTEAVIVNVDSVDTK